MATLNVVKKETKIVLKWSGIFFLTIFLLFIGVRLLPLVINFFIPPPPPEAAFGKLPPILFSNQKKENISYSLDILTSFLPNFSDRAKVYKITPEPPMLEGLEKTRQKVSEIGFKSDGVQIAEDTFQWVDQPKPSEKTKTLQRTIVMNIFSSDFTLSSPYLVTPSLQVFSGINEVNQTIKTAKSFLSDMALLPQDIDESKTKTTLYSILESTLVPTTKISDAKIVKVDFFQKDLDRLPIYYDQGISSTVNFLVGKEKDILEVVSGRFFHKNISETSSTYAIKTASEAYSELQQGKTYIASKPTGMVEFTIKKVFLGYYMGANQQEYLMPVVVFEGSNDFIAYVSAIKDEWISN